MDTKTTNHLLFFSPNTLLLNKTCRRKSILLGWSQLKVINPMAGRMAAPMTPRALTRTLVLDSHGQSAERGDSPSPNSNQWRLLSKSTRKYQKSLNSIELVNLIIEQLLRVRSKKWGIVLVPFHLSQNKDKMQTLGPANAAPTLTSTTPNKQLRTRNCCRASNEPRLIIRKSIRQNFGGSMRGWWLRRRDGLRSLRQSLRRRHPTSSDPTRKAGLSL